MLLSVNQGPILPGLIFTSSNTSESPAFTLPKFRIEPYGDVEFSPTVPVAWPLTSKVSAF